MKYVMPVIPKAPKHFRVKLDKAGRMVLPKEVRDAMGIKDTVDLEMNERGIVRIATLEQRVKEAQEYFRQFVKPGESVVDELIRERREEAAREEAKTQAWLKEFHPDD